MSYKIVVFDLDGTLVNSLYDLADSVNKGLIKAGLKTHKVDAYKKFIGNGREKLVERAMGDAKDDENLKNIVWETFNYEYSLHSNDHTEDYPGCAELLDKLADKGILTGVLSNKPDEFVPAILKKIYPNHNFLEAWGQKPQYQCKPNKESLLALLNLHNIKPEECLYVGDSNVDVFTAKNAGTDLVCVDWGFREKEELLEAGAKIVVSTAEEIYKIAVGMND